MKKGLLFLGILLLAACGNEDLIQEDLKKDLNQILGITDNAYEENRELNEEELKLIDAFKDKYEIGQFVTSSEETYEMNVLEKRVVKDVDFLETFTESEPVLESEEDDYTKVRKEVEEYLTAKEMPKDLEGMEEHYPTYEIYTGIHPEIKKDAQGLVVVFESIVNGANTEVDQSEIDDIRTFLNKYEGVDFEIDGKLYYLNDESRNVIFTFDQLKEDILNGGLTGMTAELFNETKEEVDN